MASETGRPLVTVSPESAALKEPVSRADIVLITAAISLASIHLLCLLMFGYGRDQGVFAVVADEMLKGAVPYRDVWDIKPPGIFFIYALARLIFGEGTHAIRLLEAGALASLVLAFTLLSRRFLGSALPGLLGGSLAVITHVELGFWHTAQAESFGAVLIAWAILFSASAADRPAGSALRWLLCGAFYGLAFLLKPFFAAGILVSAFLAWKSGRWKGDGVPALGVGFLLPLASTLLYFRLTGGLPALIETIFHFAPRYAAVDAGRATLPWFLFWSLEQSICWFSNLTMPGLILLAITFRRRRRGNVVLFHVAAVAVLLIAGVAVQKKFFAYHYAPLLPLVSLLAGWGLREAWGRARLSWPGIGAYALAIAILLHAPTLHQTAGGLDSPWHRLTQYAVALVRPEIRPELLDRLHSLNDVDAAANRRVAEWLRSRTRPEERIFIWGFEPALYDMADRRPASRFIHNQPQRLAWSAAEARVLLMEDLERSRPAAIVVAHGDVFPRVVGNDRDSAGELETFPDLLDLLAGSYERAERIGQFDIYVRKSDGQPTGRLTDVGRSAPRSVRRPGRSVPLRA